MGITLKPIGIAINQERQHFGGWSKVVTDLVMNEEYKEALRSP